MEPFAGTAALPHMRAAHPVVETPDYLAGAKAAGLSDDERTAIADG